MYLIINQAILPHYIALVKKEIITKFRLKGGRNDILKKINQILKKNKFTFRDVKGIIVFSDNLSFTQLRIVVTIANLMGKFLNIPTSFLKEREVKDKKINEIIRIAQKKLTRKIILPYYDKEPNIMPILSKSVAIGNKIEHPPKSAK